MPTKNPRKVKHKFFAIPTQEDGIRFPSKKEAEYYVQLKRRIDGGGVIFFLMQVPLHLPGGVKYIVDFLEFHDDGTVHFVDVKGFETKEFKLKKKLVESLYPITIEVV